jgi:RNase P subunit RPR2
MNNDNIPKDPDKFIAWLEKQIQKLAEQIDQELEKLTCPKCDGPLGEHPALSRRDNKTKICSACGSTEAIEDAFDLTICCDASNRFRTRIVMTRGVEEFPEAFVKSCLNRHAHMDWGDLDAEDKKTNDNAVKNGGRVLSSYELRGDKLWIITEADRSVTTILTPDEY